jgi:hypothetical protein
MLNQQTPNMPGIGAMTDTLEFVKNLWGSMGVPGMTLPGMSVPSMSVEDLDKKIADLKAVEAWLKVNLAMLRGTVQALEVQRGTIATLKSMGATLAQAIKQPGASEKTVMAAAPFVSAFFPQAAAESGSAAKPAAAQASADALQMPNPVAWWNMLQEQFTQAVAASMPAESAAAPGATAPGADTANQSGGKDAPAAGQADAQAKARPGVKKGEKL